MNNNPYGEEAQARILNLMNTFNDFKVAVETFNEYWEEDSLLSEIVDSCDYPFTECFDEVYEKIVTWADNVIEKCVLYALACEINDKLEDAKLALHDKLHDRCILFPRLYDESIRKEAMKIAFENATQKEVE